MADQDPANPQADSAAAEARKTIDAQKAEIAELKSQVVALGQKNHVERFVRGRGIADDAAVDQWVDTLMPSAGGITFESPAQFQEALGERFGQMMPQPGEAPTPTPPTPPAENVTTPQVPAPADPANTPGFAQPNPGAPGTPPAEQVYTLGDEYVQNLIAANDQGTLKALYDAGRLQGTPVGGRYPTEG